MSSKRQTKKLGKEQLQRIIDLGKSIEERGLDPFLVDVNDVIKIVSQYFPDWNSMDELSLDSEAVNRLASIIKLQSDWVRHRSTSLYADPFLIEEKLRKLSRKDLASLFLKTWHPIVEMEQISSKCLLEALKYWQSLVPMDERWIRSDFTSTELGATSREELINQQIVAEKFFTEELETLWKELKQKAGENGKTLYWDFVGSDSFEETVRRAYMTSFLVSYGYATFEVNRLEEEIFIIPFSKPRSLLGNRQSVSVPVSVSLEEWRHWRKSKLD